LNDQISQAVIDVRAPRIRTGTVALLIRNETHVGEPDFRLAPFLGKLKDDPRAVPLGLVLDELQVAVHDEPDDLLPGNQLRDLLFAGVKILVPVGPFGPTLVGGALDVAGPPPTDVVDRVVRLFRRLIDYERVGEVAATPEIPPGPLPLEENIEYCR
jgi:hypothetical protein